jgi:hypothetical protein
MTELEKCLNNLASLLEHYDPNFFTNAVNKKAYAKDIRDYLALREPVEPTWDHKTPWCGNCHNHLTVLGLNIRDNYCGKCGRLVKWDADTFQKNTSYPITQEGR